ncbi:MAG TPA: amino acid permease [Candidatus Acidoferrales bacterium]|nr:amino acid permease [Candidatus Acidoferrales bacterium]
MELPRKLGLWDSTAIVVGTIIGAGIFLVPNLVARSLPSAGWMIAAWVFTGALSFFGALAYAELGAMIPATGGQYVFLREAWGPLFAFLCGWTFFFVVLSASVGWLAITFATYLAYFVPIGPATAKAVAVALIATVTAVNYRGVTVGAGVQNSFTAIKLAALAVLIGAAFFGAHPPPPAYPPGPVTLSGFGVAMISCVLSYDGWVALSFVAGEVKNPKRNLPLAIALGLGVAIAVYVLAIVAYLRVLSVGEIAATERVGALAAERSLGAAGGNFVAFSILMSIVGGINGWCMTAPRIYFAQARDGLFFKRFAAIHPRFETPYISIVMFGAWSALLAITGTYESLASYAMFAAWAFYALTTLGLVVLRYKRPDLPRPYRMTGYPATLAIFALVAIGFVVNTFVATPRPAVIGSFLILSGVPVYFLWKTRV